MAIRRRPQGVKDAIEVLFIMVAIPVIFAV